MSPVEGFDTAGFLVYTLVQVGAAGVFLAIGFRPLGDRVDLWARSRGVPLTKVTRPWVVARLQRTRRWRTAGFVLWWLIPYVETLIRGSAYEETIFQPEFLLVGYVLAALLAELSASRSVPRSGAADLTAREIDSYLPLGARRVARAAGVASLAVAAVYPLVSLRDGAPEVVTIGWQALVVVGLLVAVETLPRVVVKRRQPFHGAEALRVDDAMRSWSAHAVTGALLAMMLLIVANQLWPFAYGGTMQAVRWLGAGTSLLFFAGGLAAFVHLSAYDNTWRVPRWRKLANP